MALKKLLPEIAATISDRIGDEYTAHYFYRNASNFCENIGYQKAAKFFAQEAADELTHAEGLQKYLTDWNLLPELKSISAPKTVKGLVDILEKAYAMELALHEQYEKFSKMALTKFDMTTFNFLNIYLERQQAAVAEYSTFLNKLDLIDKTDKNWVTEFEENAFD